MLKTSQVVLEEKRFQVACFPGPLVSSSMPGVCRVKVVMQWAPDARHMASDAGHGLCLICSPSGV